MKLKAEIREHKDHWHYKFRIDKGAPVQNVENRIDTRLIVGDDGFSGPVDGKIKK